MKTFRILPLLLAVVLLALSLTSCASLFNKIVDGLDEAGVEVRVRDTDMSTDYQTVAQRLTDAGYEVELSKETDSEIDCVATIRAYRYMTDGTDGILIAYFKDQTASKAYWDENKDLVEKAMDEKAPLLSEVEYGINGSVVYCGTENAVKASK